GAAPQPAFSGDHRRAQPAHVRAQPLPLPVAAGGPERPEQRPGDHLGHPAGPDPPAAPDGPDADGERPRVEPRARVAVLPGLLHGRVLVDHREAPPGATGPARVRAPGRALIPGPRPTRG